jgi:hypothetical protein
MSDTPANTPTVPVIQTIQPAAPPQQQPDSMPTDASRQGSGVIDPPVTVEESSFINEALEAFDGPSSEDVLEYNLDPNNLPADPTVPLPLEQKQQIPGQAAPQAQPQVPGVQQVQPQAPGEVIQQVIPPQGVNPANAPQPQAPQATPAVPPQGQPAAQAVAPGQELEALRGAVEAQREQFVQVAAQGYRDSFTEADVEEFQTNPREGLSKMAARLHADIVQNVLSMVSSQVPKMISSLQVAQTANKEREDVFFSQNPDLSQHRAVVNNVARTYRAMNPHMDAVTFSQHVAQLARMQAGLAPTTVQQQPAPQALPGTVVAPQPRAFAPAGAAHPPANAAPNGNVQPQANSGWAFMDQILEADQQGLFEAR